LNPHALLTISRIVEFVGKAVLFILTAVFFGGIGWIWGDTFFGTGPGIVLGLVVGICAGWLAVRILNALVNWIFPDLKRMKQEYREYRNTR
jgi:hypothetical protein